MDFFELRQPHSDRVSLTPLWKDQAHVIPIDFAGDWR